MLSSINSHITDNCPITTTRGHVYLSPSFILDTSQVVIFMWPTWGPPGADRTQVGPMWVTWTLLSGMRKTYISHFVIRYIRLTSVVSQDFERYHQMETLSALLALCEGNPSATGGFPKWRPLAQSFWYFLWSAWTNGWVNNRDAGDLRRHRAHYYVTVMSGPPNWIMSFSDQRVTRNLWLLDVVKTNV